MKDALYQHSTQEQSISIQIGMNRHLSHFPV